MFLLSLLTAALLAGGEPAPDAQGANAPRSDSRLAVIRTAPDFTLTTQDERPLRWADLRGKVVLVSFVFTTCNGTCPATTHRMSTVAQKLREQGLFKGDAVRLVSVT